MEVVKVAHLMDITAFLNLLQKTTKNISKSYHSIGEWIAARQKLYKRAGIHNMDAEWVMEMMNAEQYQAMSQFYILNQNDVSAHLFQRFGPKEVTKSKFIVNNYILVMCVTFNDELLHSYLGQLLRMETIMK